ncbi:hypothetical protein ABFG93_21240 (plasmid) [Pseudalkalibacillus hwajinpoensis]|uniref:DUF6895 family protein n=1 Tax=Guptibacillus hwajinpoensis TaxID=208199 RepID=UPI00325AC39A
MKNDVQFNQLEFQDLKKYATSSIDWIDRNLERFSPIRTGDFNNSDLKSFAELTLVYALLEEWNDLHIDNHLSKWRNFILKHCEEQSYAQMVRKSPRSAFLYLLPYLMLRSTGYRSTYYEDTLDYIQRWGYFESIELVPYRSLDLQYMCWKSGYFNHEPDWYKLYRSTVLGRFRSPLSLDNDAAYSVTHTLFYLTDFGNRNTPIAASEIDHVTKLIEYLLIHYWRVGHWDLMGELLINLNCLGRNDSFIYAKASQAFQEAWRNDGGIPGMRLERDLDREDDEEETFQNCYHTTLVGVLYCATSMNSMRKEKRGDI